MNQLLLASNLPSAAPSPLLAFIDSKRVRALLWIWFWLKEILWLVWSIQTTKSFSVSAGRLFGFLIICVFTGVALLIFFKNFSFAFATWLTLWNKRSSFQLISAFNVPSSLSLIISSFWFNIRDLNSCFTWTLRGHRSTNNWRFQYFLCLGGQEGLRRWKEEPRTVGLWSSQNTKHSSIKFTSLSGCGLWHPKTITIVTPKITDHRNKYNNSETL